MLTLKLLPMKYSRYVKFVYFNGYLPNVNNPNSFNEHINKRILDTDSNKDDIKDSCDKLKNEKKFSKIANLHIVEKFWVGYEVPECLDIDPNTEWVFKPNFSSGKIYFGIGPIGSTERKKLIKLANKWQYVEPLKESGEWPYAYAEKKFIIEKKLKSSTTGLYLNDYKFHVFNGKVKIIQVDIDRFKNHTRNLYDRNGDFINTFWQYPNHKDKSNIMTENILEMIKICEIIGQNLSFMRIDLYFSESKIWFGELSPFPGSGFDKFSTREMDLKFGTYFRAF